MMPKRRISNYLLDRPLQLRFTGYSVSAALCIAALLGVFLWNSHRVLMREAEAAVDARAEAASTSRELGRVALSSTLAQGTVDPVFEKQLLAKSAAIDEAYQKEHAQVVAQRSDLLRRQRWAWFNVVLSLALFIVLIGAAGIVATHRIAGPLYRLKRTLDAIAAGQLTQPPVTLREHDELQEHFTALGEMVKALRMRDEAALATLERVRRQAEEAGMKSIAESLTALEEHIRTRLERPVSGT
ncbi:MAG: signal protein [Myxococcaceae bacterium]